MGYVRLHNGALKMYFSKQEIALGKSYGWISSIDQLVDTSSIHLKRPNTYKVAEPGRY